MGFAANAKASDLSQQELKALLQWEPSTGKFTWKVQRMGGAKPGDPAGRVESKGYIQIGVKRRRYMAHRLVWLWVTGRFPDEVIDHINGDKQDNRFENLRAVSFIENLRAYRKPKVGKSSSYRGVSLVKGKWFATIRRGGKAKHLGSFSTQEEAGAAFQQALLLEREGDHRGVAL